MSFLVGKAYEVAGQAGGSQHTMSVLQAYQADLLRKLDTGEDLSPEVVKELHKATDPPLSRWPVLSTVLWLVWWLWRGICGSTSWGYRIKKELCCWASRSRHLACLAALSVQSSAGFRWQSNPRPCSSSSLAGSSKLVFQR